MRIFVIDNVTFNLPNTWNELSEPQLLHVAELVGKSIDKHEFLLSMFLHATGLKVKQTPNSKHYYLTNGKKEFALNAEQILQLCNVFSFLLTEQKTDDETTYTILSRRTKALTSFELYGETYYAPASSLTNISLHEYIFSETYYHHYASTGKEEYLNLFIATLYRPQARNYDETQGDKREAFNDFIIEKHAKLISALPAHVKTSIRWFYEGSSVYIHKKFASVFQGAPSGTKQDVFEGFMKMVNGLSGNDITKNDQVRQSNLYEALLTLDELMQKSKKQ